jgi:hypothetical protein
MTDAASAPAETAKPVALPVGFTLVDGTITVTGTVRSKAARSRLLDAVKADHSKAAPAFLGSCDDKGTPTEHEVLAILKPTGADKENRLPAATAWRVDYPSARFVSTDASNLMCPHEGIATADGGP